MTWMKKPKKVVKSLATTTYRLMLRLMVADMFSDRRSGAVETPNSQSNGKVAKGVLSYIMAPHGNRIMFRRHNRLIMTLVFAIQTNYCTGMTAIEMAFQYNSLLRNCHISRPSDCFRGYRAGYLV